MPPRAEDLTGRRFGRLLVVAATKQSGKTAWICHCDCGGHKTTMATSLRNGSTQSCGCIHREVMQAIQTKHGLSATPEFVVWGNMKSRCYNPKAINYERYGGRGITICDRWRHDFAAFYADMGKRPSLTENCYWATPKQQSNNRRVRRALPSRDRNNGRWLRKP
jgi:hypothetical protein